MMSPHDTALLKHQPDHLQPLSEADRAANKIVSNARATFRELVSQALAFIPRNDQASDAGCSVREG